MAKRSRRTVRGESTTVRPVASTTTPSSTTPPPTTTRPSTSTAPRRARPRRVRQQSPLERYRGLIIGGAAVIGILLLGFVLFQSSTAKAYVCDSELTPGPVESVTPRPSILATPTPTPAPSGTASAAASGAPPSGSPSTSGSPAATGSPAASPAPSPAAPGSPDASASGAPSASPGASPSAPASPAADPTARLGFSTDILGNGHPPVGTVIDYGFCPPTSGDHYNNPPRGPLPANFYPPNQEPAPGGWVHNLEHGYVALLYRCPGGVAGAEGCPAQQQLDELRQWFQNAPAPPSGCPKKVLVVRFDELTTQFAMVSWGRALLTDTFDTAVANTFAQQWMEHESLPERANCT